MQGRRVYGEKNGAGYERPYFSIAAACSSLCAAKSAESLTGSAGSGRNRWPQIEQTYSPVHTLLPSWRVIAALRQIFFPAMCKAYTGSSRAAVENPGLRVFKTFCRWNFAPILVKLVLVRQTNRRSLRNVMGV